MDKDGVITVCASCLTASCWQGIFYCEDYRHAGITTRTVTELKTLSLEHSDYWKKEA